MKISFKEPLHDLILIEITDFLGQKVFSQNFDTKNEIVIISQNLSKGIYLLTTTINNQKTTQKVIIK